MKGNRTNQRLALLQAGREDPTQDGVVSSMDHHLVLILTEGLDWVALTRVAIEGWNHEFLKKFKSQYAFGERGVRCTGDDGSKSAEM